MGSSYLKFVVPENLPADPLSPFSRPRGRESITPIFEWGRGMTLSFSDLLTRAEDIPCDAVANPAAPSAATSKRPDHPAFNPV